MVQQFQPWALLVGRVLLSLIFLLSGTMKISKWSETAGQMTNEGMIAVPFFLAAAILFEVGGGLSVLLGYWARAGALALVLFLIPVTLIFHDFWVYKGMEMQNQMQHFMKNWTIIGGLLVVAAAGAGRLSLDGWLARKTRGP